MPLIRDLKSVKDEEITLLDVKRAEEIIERANKLLGRKMECHHYHGFTYSPWVFAPYYPNQLYSTTLTTSTSGTISSPALNLNDNITTAANILSV